MATVPLRPKAKKNRIRPKLKPIVAQDEYDDEGLGYGEWAPSPVKIRSKGSSSEEDEKKHEDPNDKLEKAMMSARLQPFLSNEEIKMKERNGNEHDRALPAQRKCSFDNRLHLSESITEGKAIDSKATTILIEDNLNLHMLGTRIWKGLVVLLCIAFSCEVFSLIVIAKVKMSHDGLYDNVSKVLTSNNNTSAVLEETVSAEALSSLKEGDEVTELFNPLFSKEEMLLNVLHGNKVRDEDNIETQKDGELLGGSHELSCATEEGSTEVEQSEMEDFLPIESYVGDNEQHSDEESESKSEDSEITIDQLGVENTTESEADVTKIESDSLLPGEDKLDDSEESLPTLEEVASGELTEQITLAFADEEVGATQTLDLTSSDGPGDKLGTTGSSTAETEGFDSEIQVKQSEEAIKVDVSGSNYEESPDGLLDSHNDDEDLSTKEEIGPNQGLASSDSEIESVYGSQDQPDVTEEIYAYSVEESPAALQEDLKIGAEEVSTNEEGETSLDEILDSHDRPDGREEDSGIIGAEVPNVDAASYDDKLVIETAKSLMASEEMNTDETELQTTSVMISEEQQDATIAQDLKSVEKLGYKSDIADSDEDFDNMDEIEFVVEQTVDTNEEHDSGSKPAQDSVSGEEDEPDKSTDSNLSPFSKEIDSDEDDAFDASLSGESESDTDTDNCISTISVDEDEHFDDAKSIDEVAEDDTSTGDDDDQNGVGYPYMDDEEHEHEFEASLHTLENKRGILVRLNEFKDTFERYEIIDAIIGHVVCAIPKLLWKRIVVATLSLKARFPKKHEKDEIGI